MPQSLDTVSRIIVRAEETGVEEVTAKYRELTAEGERVAVILERGGKSAEGASRGLENLRKRTDDAHRDARRFSDAMRTLSNAFEQGLIGKGADDFEALNREVDKVTRSLKTVQQAERDAARAAEQQAAVQREAEKAEHARVAAIESVNKGLVDQIAKLRLSANEYEKYAALQRAGTTGAAPEGRAIVGRLDIIQQERAAQKAAADAAREQAAAQARADAEAERAAADALRAEQARLAAIESVNRGLVDQIAKLRLSADEYEKLVALQRAGTTGATPEGRGIVARLDLIQKERAAQKAAADAAREQAAAQAKADAEAERADQARLAAIESVNRALTDQIARVRLSADEYERYAALQRAGTTATTPEGQRIVAKVGIIQQDRSMGRMAAEARELLQQIDPVLAAQKRLENQLKRNKQIFDAGLFGKGAEGMNNFAKANQHAEKQAQNAAKGIGLASHEIQNLSYQVNDIASGLISGQSPFTIMLQQGGQVIQILNGPRGLGAGLREAGTWLASLVTPARAFGLGLAGAAFLAVKAWNDWDNSQKEVTRTLTGLGRSLGVTKDQFNAMAETAAKAGGVSVSSARDMLNTLARTGQVVNPQDLVRAVSLAKDYADTFTNGDVQAAMQEQANLIKGGAAAIQSEMQQRGLVNEGNRIALERAAQLNKTAEAYGLFLDSLNGKLVKHAEVTGNIASGWDRIKTAVSDTMDAVGPILDKMANAAATFLEHVARGTKALLSADFSEHAPSQAAAKRTSIALAPVEGIEPRQFTGPEQQDAVRAMREATEAAKEQAKAQDKLRDATKATADATRSSTAGERDVAAAAERSSEAHNKVRGSVEAKAKASREAKGADESVARTTEEGAKVQERMRAATEAKAKATRDSKSADQEVARTAQEAADANKALQNAIAAAANTTRDSTAGERDVAAASERVREAHDKTRAALDAKAKASRDAKAADDEVARATEESARIQDRMRAATDAKSEAVRNAKAADEDAARTTKEGAGAYETLRGAITATARAVLEAITGEKESSSAAEEGARAHDKVRSALEAKTKATLDSRSANADAARTVQEDAAAYEQLQNAIAAQGTAYGSYVDSLNAKLGNHSELAGKIAGQWDKLKTAFSDLLSTAGSWLEKLGPILEKLTGAGTSFIDTVNRGVQAAVGQRAEQGPAAALSARPRFSDVAEPSPISRPDREAVRATREATEASRDYAKAQEQVREATKKKAEATRESTGSERDVAAAAERSTEAHNKVRGAVEAKAKATRDSKSADKEVTDTTEEGAKAQEKLRAATDAKAKSTRDSKSADEDVARTTQEAAKANKDLEGAIASKNKAAQDSTAGDKDVAAAAERTREAHDKARGAVEANAKASRDAKSADREVAASTEDGVRAQEKMRAATDANTKATRDSKSASEDSARTTNESAGAFERFRGAVTAKARAVYESIAGDKGAAQSTKESARAQEEVRAATENRAKATSEAANQEKAAAGASKLTADQLKTVQAAIDARAQTLGKAVVEEKGFFAATEEGARAQNNLRAALEKRAKATRDSAGEDNAASNAATKNAEDHGKVRVAVEANTNSLRGAAAEERAYFERGQEGAKAQDRLRGSIDAKAEATRRATDAEKAAGPAMNQSAKAAETLEARLAAQKRELSDTLGSFKPGQDPEAMKDVERRIVLVTEALSKGTQAQKENAASLLEGKASREDVKKALEEQAAAQVRAAEIANQEIQTANKATESRIPEIAQRRELINLRDAILAKPESQRTDADTEALARFNNQLKSTIDDQGRRITQEARSRKEIELGNREITDRTVRQRAATAEERKRNELVNSDMTGQQRANEIRAAGARVSLEASDAIKRQSEELDRELKAIEEEKGLIFASNAERAAAIAMRQKENELIRQNGDATDAASQALIRQTGEVARARAELSDYQNLWGGVRDAGTSAMTSLVQDLAKGTKAGDAFKKAIASMGDQLLGIAGKNIFGGISNSISTLASGGGGQAAMSALTGAFSSGNLIVGGIGALLSIFGQSNAEKKAKKQKQAQEFLDKQQKEQEEAMRKQEEELQKQIDLQERINDYQERLSRAQLHGNDTLAGRLQLFEIEAQRDRADEMKSGGQAIVQLEAALAAERINIIEDFNKEVLNRSKSYQDRLFAATNDSETLLGQLIAFDREANRQREEEARLGGGAMTDLEAALAAERLKIMREFNNDALAEQRKFYADLRKTIQKFIDDLKGGAQSPLSPLDRLAEAQGAFETQYAKARRGNRDAAEGITGYATTLLDAARDAFASGQQFQEIYKYIVAALQSIQKMGLGNKAAIVTPTPPPVAKAANTNIPAANTNIPPMPTSMAAAVSTNIPPVPTPAAQSSTGDLMAEIRQLRTEVAAFRIENRESIARDTNVVHADLQTLTGEVRTTADRQARETRVAALRPRTGTNG